MSRELQPESGPQRRILSTTDHPEFGKTVTFVDQAGVGMEIGEGEEAFIVRPLATGFVQVEAITEEAKETARRLMGKVIDQRGGHR